jgi:hypothetical protein
MPALQMATFLTFFSFRLEGRAYFARPESNVDPRQRQVKQKVN